MYLALHTYDYANEEKILLLFLSMRLQTHEPQSLPKDTYWPYSLKYFVKNHHSNLLMLLPDIV